MSDKVGQAEETLASFITKTNYRSLPPETLEVSKNAIFDCIGVALAGAKEPLGKIMLAEIKEWGGNPQAAVFGGGFRTSVPAASLINGALAHALDYDDISEDWMGHPSAVLVPAVLAMGERCQSSGKEVLTAYVVGFEVGSKLGIALSQSHYPRGWHSTATIGAIASAAAAAKLLKLNVQQTKMALGIAASMASGLRENFGTMTKPLHAGNAARNGNLAALLAKRGFTSSERALTADMGYCKVLGADKYDLNTPLSQLGKKFSIITPGIWLKSYPACGCTHSPIEAALQLKKQYDFKAADIVAIDCAIPKFVPQILIHHHPKTDLEGKFSLEYSVAVALADNQALLSQFTDERVNAADVQGLIAKTKYRTLAELGDKYDLTLPVTITVTLRNGKKISATVDTPTGKPENPMSPQVLTDKFQDCAGALPARSRKEVVKLALSLEKMTKINELMDLVMGKARK